MLRSKPQWLHFTEVKEAEKGASVFHFLNKDPETWTQLAIVYEPKMTPFLPSVEGSSAGNKICDSIGCVFDILPHRLKATHVIYSPWQVDLFVVLQTISPTLAIAVRGVPVVKPSDGLIIAAINRLRIWGDTIIDRACVFREVRADSYRSDQIDFYENQCLLRGPTLTGPRALNRCEAEVRFGQMLKTFDASLDDGLLCPLPRYIFNIKRRALKGLGYSFVPTANCGKDILFLAPDCAFVRRLSTTSASPVETARNPSFLLHHPVAPEPALNAIVRLKMREINFEILRPKFALCYEDNSVFTSGACEVYVPHLESDLFIKAPPKGFLTDHDAFDDLQPNEGEAAAAASASDESESESESGDEDAESANTLDSDTADAALTQACVARLSVPRSSPQCHGARHISVYTAKKIDMDLDEFVDLNRLQDALRWRSLTCRDARILTLFEKQDGRHHVNYDPPPEDDTNPSKKAKKKDPPPPTGLRFLTPGVRQFVLQEGTICIDAPQWHTVPTEFSHRRKEVCSSIATFWDRGSEVGILPSGMKLVSLVPEGFLVRGFLRGPPTAELFATCRSVVLHDTGVDVGDFEVVNLNPLSGTSHPLDGDFRLWEEADLTEFTAPLFIAMRKVIENKPHRRAFNWFYETEGNLGKTVHAKYYAQRGACCVSAQTPSNIFFAIKDHVHKSGTLRLLIVDVPRDMTGINESFAGAIESIKDGLIFSGKYESGTVKLPSPTIILFANAPMPDSFKYALSPDRWREVDLRNTRVHAESKRFILSASDFPGVYTDTDNYVPLETLEQTTRFDVSHGTLETITEVNV